MHKRKCSLKIKQYKLFGLYKIKNHTIETNIKKRKNIDCKIDCKNSQLKREKNNSVL